MYHPYPTFDSRDWWTPDERELFIKVNSEVLAGIPDAIVWVEGDADDRVRRSVELFEQFNGTVPIVLTGGVKGNPYRPDADIHPDGGNIPAWEIKEFFLNAGVPEDKVILEPASLNARDQAINVVKMAKENGWKRLVLVASTWHQPRLFLTFVKQLHVQGAEDIELINQSEMRFPLDRQIPGRGKNTLEMIREDLWRITKYIENGSVVPAEDGLRYMGSWPKKEFAPPTENVENLLHYIPVR